MPRRHGSGSRAFVHAARRQLHESERHRNVLGVAYGQRQVRGEWTNQHGIVVFVTRKPRRGTVPEDDEILPRHLYVHDNGHRHKVPVDVVSVGGARGRFAVALDDCIATTSGGSPAGCVSWFQGGVAITAEHVTGFGGVGVPVYAGGAGLGKVTHTAYETTHLDAARFDPPDGMSLQNVIHGTTVSVSAARYVTGDDVFTGSNYAFAYPPSAGGSRTQVVVRAVHATGTFPFTVGGATYYPSTLILTDPCTLPGDSGCVLLGSDGLAIGLLTGLVDTPNGHSYSLFTELGPALDVLVPSW